MALNQPDQRTVVKAASEADKLKEIKFSASLGSVYVAGTKYTDLHNALVKINGK